MNLRRRRLLSIPAAAFLSSVAPAIPVLLRFACAPTCPLAGLLPVTQGGGLLSIALHYHLLRADLRQHDPGHGRREAGEATEGGLRPASREAVRGARGRPQHAQEVRNTWCTVSNVHGVKTTLVVGSGLLSNSVCVRVYVFCAASLLAKEAKDPGKRWTI